MGGTTLGVSSLSSQKIDTEGDGVTDQIKMLVKFSSTPANVQSIMVFMNIDYLLEESVNVKMKSLLLASISTPSGASNVILDGEIKLKQVNPFAVGSVLRQIHQTNLLQSLETNSFLTILDTQYSRNETAFLDYSSLVSPSGSSSETTVQLNMRVPKHQEVLFVPSVLQRVKFAWIQYLALLIPIYWICFTFLDFLFKKQVLQTNVLHELPALTLQQKAKSNY